MHLVTNENDEENSLDKLNVSSPVNYSYLGGSYENRLSKRKAPYFPLSNQYFYLFFSVVLSFLFGWSLEIYLLSTSGVFN